MIYIGTFLQVTNQEALEEKDRRHGEFSLIVQAEGYEAAVEKFKSLILDYRETSELFKGISRIFFIQLIEFADIPTEKALMMTYQSYAGDPLLPFIGCSLTDGASDSCKIYNWKENELEVDGFSGKLFLEFDAH